MFESITVCLMSNKEMGVSLQCGAHWLLKIYESIAVCVMSKKEMGVTLQCGAHWLLKICKSIAVFVMSNKEIRHVAAVWCTSVPQNV
jgi:hypothetical protein